MNLLFFILGFAWIVRILLNVLSYIHLWWVKEYRFDRMLVHLKTEQGKWIFFLPFHRPPISPKTLVLFVASLITLVILYFSFAGSLFIRFVLADLLTFPVVGCFALLLRVPTMIYHEVLIFFAIRRLRTYPKLVTVGITGSFGKTSTKEYLATIIKNHYEVIKTSGSKNSPIAIAELVLHKLTKPFDVFLVEMAAYKRGEIARMADMVLPQVGIVTAINEQHQDLFGSIEATMEAKYELISGLGGRKIAIVNGDNMYVRRMGEKANRRKYTVWVYTTDEKKEFSFAKKIFRASSIISNEKGVSFQVHVGEDTLKVHAPVLGEHQVSNILAAIAGATACGMKLAEAAKAASQIQPFESTLQPLPQKNGVLFIDDTFNNNPDAAKAAIGVLAKTKSRKFLVFQPMIELGKYTSKAHEDVGAYAAKICDEIILTNLNFHADFMRGVRRVDPKKHIWVYSATEAASFLRKKMKKGDTVLFKGKESKSVLMRLIGKH